VRRAIRWIFDTDGTIYFEHKNNKLYPRIIVGTIYQRLGLRLQKLISKNGMKATMYKELRQHKNWNDLYLISIRCVDMLHKWMDIIEPANQKTSLQI